MSTGKVDLDFFTLPKPQAHPADKTQAKSLENPPNCHFEALLCNIFIEAQKSLILSGGKPGKHGNRTFPGQLAIWGEK